MFYEGMLCLLGSMAISSEKLKCLHYLLYQLTYGLLQSTSWGLYYESVICSHHLQLTLLLESRIIKEEVYCLLFSKCSFGAKTQESNLVIKTSWECIQCKSWTQGILTEIVCVHIYVTNIYWHYLSCFFSRCTGFVWQTFTSIRVRDKGSISAAVSVRNCQKLPLYPVEPMPDGSNTDMLLAKGEPINGSGSASGITYLRRG